MDWLPPVHVHIYATCNCYDHKPHLENIWEEITTTFKAVMDGNLFTMLTGKGADGDSRERSMFLQSMYSRPRGMVHPRGSSFCQPISNTSTWVSLAGKYCLGIGIELLLHPETFVCYCLLGYAQRSPYELEI